MKIIKNFALPLILFLPLFFAGCSCHCLRGTKKPSRKPIGGNYSLIGRGRATERMMIDYIRQHNDRLSSTRLQYIVKVYVFESSYEGINHDIAFAQMCHETNFLKFGGAINKRQNNFCSLGTMGYDVYGACFFSIRDGIRAHVQHLKAYGSRLSLINNCIDPRFDLIERGCARTIDGLTTKWSPGGNYGKALCEKINSLLLM